MRVAFYMSVILMGYFAFVRADGDVMEFVNKAEDIKWQDIGTDKVYYIYSRKFITWYHAAWACKYMGLKRSGQEGKLASFKTATDLNNFHEHFKYLSGEFWIGLSRNAAGDFEWMDHSAPKYTNWDVNEPNNAEIGEDCVELRAGNLFWNNIYCHSKRGFICTSDKDMPDKLLDKPDKLPECELKGWKYFNGNCYLVRASYEDALDWMSAEQYCVDRNAHLISVLNREEEDFVFSKLLGESESLHSLWSGLRFYGKEATSNWTDGSSTSYTDFDDKSAKSGCLSLNLLHKRQQTLPCTQKIGSICKMEKPSFFESAPDSGCLLEDDPPALPEANKDSAAGGKQVAGVACDIAIRLITLTILVYMFAKLLPSYNTLSSWAQERTTWKREKSVDESAEKITLQSNVF